LRPGDYYSQQSANQTYKKIISQPLFAAANISMTYADPHYTHPNADQPLDCHIRLIRNKLNAFNIGTEGTNSGGRFGLGINSTIQNRNIFKGAEVLSLKIHTSAEMQSSLNNKDLNTGTTFLFFNTIEGGLEASLDIPRLLIPARKQYVSHTFGQTSLSAGAAFEFRPEYQRMISTAAWSYRWNSSQISRVIFTPLEFNYINIQPSDSFAKYMESLTDPQYKSQYTNHLLTAIRYSYIFSNMGMIKDNSQIFLRFDAETSGNIPFLLDKTTDIPATDEGYYEHFGIRYSQYARLNIDFRKYIKLHRQNSIAFRISGGMVVPYGNSDVVPFEKNFWLGGANDMRGWRLRSLGPGGYQGNNTRFDKTGEIMLQASIEHRFPIYSFMQGGFFIDAGNVWLRSPNQDFPEGEFKMNRFLNQIAMDLGFGLRFDLSFFIFRLDAAVPFHNPATSLWFSKDDFRIRGSILNFGIGLPF
jgi:outer membrane protein assembly factor BamA